MQHSTVSATLAEQHRHQLRLQAHQACRARCSCPASCRRWHTALPWWRPATQTASA
jgi:hypothetical protein